MTPRATYRLQFHSGFTFADAEGLAPYLASLGVSHVYASPITTARSGSTHGYDVVDPTRINPELGGEQGFRALVARLRAHGLGVILDIVPNHMAVGGSDNRWWLDVLENGRRSAFAPIFDIDWSPADPALKDRLLAPFLGLPYARALANGDIRLDFEADLARLSVLVHGTHRFPLRREDYAPLLARIGASVLDRTSFQALAQWLDPADAQGRMRLHVLLEQQHYRLAHWQVAGDEINWRRFFDITELAGIRVEDEAVFDVVHRLVLRLYGEGLIDGVRVDHVDGLADPAGYCRRLRAALEQAGSRRPADAPPGPAYLVVEKILAADEHLPMDWGTDGTSGYDFMNQLSALLHDPAGAAPLAEYWSQASGRPADFATEEHQARQEILLRHFSGQLESCVAAFHRIARSDLQTRDISAGMVRCALVALLCVFPAYRSYGTGDGCSSADAALLHRAADAAHGLAAPGEAAIIDQLVAWLCEEEGGDHADRREAVRRFQQLSAPLSAKAVEDTGFYRYGRLLSRNDVGFDPARFALSPRQFADAVATRARDFPDAMLATATHDHKRGEDVRARLAVLSEVTDVWIAQVGEWQALNADLAADVDAGDMIQLYQMMVGAWPLMLHIDDATSLAGFAERLVAWQQKALREAKLRSSWTMPDNGYEQACAHVVKTLLDPAVSGPFLVSLSRFIALIAPAGAANGLVQAALHCTMPGVPDLYQGTEYWDFSLVDPDNRRPVDFVKRIASLEDGDEIADLVPHWRDGRIKQRLIADLLHLRRQRLQLFARGDLQMVRAEGKRAANVVAFTRSHGDERLLILGVRHMATALWGADHPVIDSAFWQDTALVMDDAEHLPVAQMLGGMPVSVRLLKG